MHTIIAFKYKAREFSLLGGRLSSFVQQLCGTHTGHSCLGNLRLRLCLFYCLTAEADDRNCIKQMLQHFLQEMNHVIVRHERRWTPPARRRTRKEPRTAVTMQITAAGLIKFSRNSASIDFYSLILTHSLSLTLAVFPFSVLCSFLSLSPQSF